MKAKGAWAANIFLEFSNNRRTVVAIMVACVSEVLMQSVQVYRYSYDAYTHIFFADHYRRDWFNLWDTRWYGGFSVTTYPPLAHQLMALISLLLNPEIAYQVLAVAAHVSLAYSVYLFSKLFVDEREARYAVIVAALLPSAATVLNAFGQLPTVLATSLALIAADRYNNYLANGSVRNLFQVSLWTAASGLTHHFTFLFFVPITQLAVLIRFLKREQLLMTIRRTLLHMLLTSIMLILILWPFLLSLLAPTDWVEIPHGTRQNLFTSSTLAAVFFWGMYSFTIFLLPNAFAIAFRRRILFPLLAIFIFLLIMGLGGTTPIPRMVLGSLWQILTYDRFAFWAMVSYTPFLAVMLTDAGVFTRKYFFGKKEVATNSRARFILTAAFLAGLAGSFAFASGAGVILSLQPLELLGSDQLDEIARFLDANSQWKYITLGLGNQRILLSSKTSAATLDGGYNLAKIYPLLTRSGVESLDSAKYFPNGLSFLKTVLTEESNNGLRYVVSADEYYDAILNENGLRPIFKLEGAKSLTVWEIPYSVLRQPQSIGNNYTGPIPTMLWSLGPLTVFTIAVFTVVLDKELSRWEA